MNRVKTTVIFLFAMAALVPCSGQSNKITNGYLFIDNYVPSVMKQKGFDYVDSYKPSRATDNYFDFEKKAVERYHGVSELSPVNTTFFRCLYINEAGRIDHLLKRKITVKELPPPDLSLADEEINRMCDGETIAPEQLFRKITSSETFSYLRCEKNIAYEMVISNDTCTDLIYNSVGERLYENTPFYHAKFYYDGTGKFVDLKNMNDLLGMSLVEAVMAQDEGFLRQNLTPENVNKLYDVPVTRMMNVYLLDGTEEAVYLPDTEKNTLLHLAVREDLPLSTKILIERGAKK